MHFALAVAGGARGGADRVGGLADQQIFVARNDRSRRRLALAQMTTECFEREFHRR
jgi:hypothetical protein